MESKIVMLNEMSSGKQGSVYVGDKVLYAVMYTYQDQIERCHVISFQIPSVQISCLRIYIPIH